MDNFDFFLNKTKRIKSDRKDNSRTMWFFFSQKRNVTALPMIKEYYAITILRIFPASIDIVFFLFSFNNFVTSKYYLHKYCLQSTTFVSFYL